MPDSGTILDLGCGHGIFANLMGLRGPGRTILALERNAELVSGLKQWINSGRATVALHGYTHQDFPNGFEFEFVAISVGPPSQSTKTS